MSTSSKTFRVFISSTFSDLKEERNALQKDVFPKLRQLCLEHGFRFQAIDLRWGVREEAALNQKTVKLCLDEIIRCQRTSPRPNFIILLSDRYGWQPLPYEIPAAEFDALVKHLHEQNERELMSEWYRRDDNAVPSVYVLQPRRINFPENENPESVQKIRGEESEAWAETEKTIQKMLRTACEKIHLDDERRIKYLTSATEQEIMAGALAVPDAREHVFAFFRKIRNIPFDQKSKDFCDLTEDNTSDDDTRRKLADLKHRLRAQIGEDHTFEYQAEWTGTRVSDRHIRMLCDDVYRNLASVIQEEIARLEKIDSLDSEIDAHEVFGRDRSEYFIGRTAILGTVEEYLKRIDSHPFVVWGDSGSGKSALMAAQYKKIRKEYPQVNAICRFIGATPGSSDGRSLLDSLCRQIARLYGKETVEIPVDFENLVNKFNELLKIAADEKPLIILLDAVDQLSSANRARDLTWVPVDLPENVHIIISALAGDCTSVLEKRIPASNRIRLETMNPDEGEILLSAWLESVGRTLQNHQKELVLEKFARNGLPLYLKLAFEEARRWRSYHEAYALSGDIPGLIRDMFARLSSETEHGAMLVSRSLGYLAAAKHGLSEDEMLDVLSSDRVVYQDFIDRAYHQPPEARLPVIVWSRLYFDLEPYLIDRIADGALLMDFYHRQLREVIEADYLCGDEGVARHRHLANYFADQPLEIREDVEATPNLRKMSELPHQQTLGELWDDLYKTLTDFQFLEYKALHMDVIESKDVAPDFERKWQLEDDAMRPDFKEFLKRKGSVREKYTGIFQIVRDFEFALERIPVHCLHKKNLEMIAKTLIREIHILSWKPHVLWQQIFNRLQWKDTISQHLQSELNQRTRKSTFPWFRIYTAPQESDALIKTFRGHQDIITCFVISPDGRFVVSSSKDFTLRIWNIETGQEQALLSGHSGSVNKCAFSPDGNFVVSASNDATLKIWDVELGKLRWTLEGHHPIHPIWDGTITHDASHIISASGDGTLKIWEIETGHECSTLKGHTSSVRRCTITPDGRFVVSGDDDGMIKIWDYKSKKEHVSIQCEKYGVRNIQSSPDSSYIVTEGMENTIKIYELETGVELASFKGDSFLISAEGRFVYFHDPNDRLKAWDTQMRLESETEVRTTIGRLLAISPDGQYIISQGTVPFKFHDTHQNVSRFNKVRIDNIYNRIFELWDLKNGHLCNQFLGHAEAISDCMFLPEGVNIVSSSADKTLKLWEMNDTPEQVLIEDQAHFCLNSYIYNDKLFIISIELDGALRIWDAETDQDMITIRGDTDQIVSCEMSADGKYLITKNADATLIVWDLETRLKAAVLKFDRQVLNKNAFALSPDNISLFYISEESTLNRYDIVSGNEDKNIIQYNNKIDDFTLSPDGRFIAFGSNCEIDDEGYWTVKLWDMCTKRDHVTLREADVEGHALGIRNCAISPDNRFIAVVGERGTLKLWEIKTGQVLVELVGEKYAGYGPGISGNVDLCKISADCRFIVASDWDNNLNIWDTENGHHLALLTGHMARIYEFEISPDCALILSTSHDNTMRLWDVSSGKEIAFIPISGYPEFIRFHPSKLLVVCGDHAGTMTKIELS